MLSRVCTLPIIEDSGAIEEISESRSRGRPDKLSPQSSDAVSEPLNEGKQVINIKMKKLLIQFVDKERRSFLR
jgi:hypothetical protein